MKLRTRLLLTIGLTTVSLFVGISMLSQGLVMRSYANLETASASKNLERVQQTLDQMVAELHVKTLDWARWDDSYVFMGDRNEDFIHSNVTAEGLETLRMDYMAFVHPDLSTVATKSIERSSDFKAPNSAQLLADLRPILERKSSGRHGIDGLIQHQEATMLVSVLPIQRSNGTGGDRGWIIFATYLDQARLDSIRNVTRLDVEAFPAVLGKPPTMAVAQFEELSPSSPSLVDPLDDQVIAGYTRMADIFGQPVLYLRVKEPRSIYQQGQASVTLLNQIIVLVGLVFCAVVIFVLERFALSRLSSLTRQVAKIGDTGLNRVRVRGKDELSDLATQINAMLRGLAEERIRVLEQRQQIAAKNLVLESAIEGIGRLDDSGKLTSVNTSFARMFGSASDEMIGRHWSSLCRNDDKAIVQSAIETVRHEGRSEILIQAARSNGGEFFLEATLIEAVNNDGSPNGLHFFAKDVTERKRLENEIKHQAFHDKLTDLPNRALFMDRIAQAFAKSRRHGLGTAVLFIDLDNFKLVNDSLGHDAGDSLLIEVANRLRLCVRPGDTVARLGGDEFTILLEDLTSTAEAEMVAQRITSALSVPIHLGDTEAFASATIGIAFADDPGMTPESLMKNADTTMYHAKAKGKSCYAVYEESMKDSVTERMELETALRKALENGEIFVHYQPLIDLQTGLTIGSEALARWNHPTRGLVPPNQFIPIAEETGLIMPIGYFILEESCRQTREWQVQHGRKDLTISVNLSGRQLQQNDVVARVDGILKRTGLAPQCLKLEITESVLMDRIDSLEKLRHLKTLGIQLALDDFGTGYSSLSRLGSYPIDTIKIDRSFISRIDYEEHTLAVVQAIMALSRSMKMDVTGEGVETDGQLKIIQGLGCQTGQGYLFARPMDAAQFGKRLISLDEDRRAA